MFLLELKKYPVICIQKAAHTANFSNIDWDRLSLEMAPINWKIDNKNCISLDDKFTVKYL